MSKFEKCVDDTHMDNGKGDPSGHTVRQKETESRFTKDNDDSTRGTHSKNEKRHHSPHKQLPHPQDEHCHSGNCHAEGERKSKRKRRERRARSRGYASKRGHGKRREKETDAQNKREIRDLNLLGDSTESQRPRDYKSKCDRKCPQTFAESRTEDMKTGPFDLIPDLKAKFLDLFSKYPNVLIKKHNGRLEIEKITKKELLPSEMQNDNDVTPAALPLPSSVQQFRSKYDNYREGSTPRESVDVSHFRPYIKGRKNVNDVSEPDRPFGKKNESILTVKQVAEELDHMCSGFLGTDKSSDGREEVDVEPEENKRLMGNLKDLPNHTSTTNHFRTRNFDEELMKNTDKTRKRLIEDVQAYILGGKMSPCEPNKPSSVEKRSEGACFFLSENSHKLSYKKHNGKFCTMASDQQNVPCFEHCEAEGARHMDVHRTPEKDEGNNDSSSEKVSNKANELTNTTVENLDGHRKLIIDCGKQTETKAVSDRTRKSPWTCTKWPDATTNERVDLASYRCPKWSYEVYSDTGLTRPDVGMATTDKYKSYIGCRKNSEDRPDGPNLPDTVKQPHEEENQNVSSQYGAAIRQVEVQGQGDSLTNARILDDDKKHEFISPSQKANDSLQNPNNSFQNNPAMTDKLKDQQKFSKFFLRKDPESSSEGSLRKNKYSSLDTANSGSLQLNCNAAVTHQLWLDSLRKQKPMEFEETFVKRTANVEETLAKTTSVIADTLTSAFQKLMGTAPSPTEYDDPYGQAYEVYRSGRQEYEEKMGTDEKEYEIEIFDPSKGNILKTSSAGSKSKGSKLMPYHTLGSPKGSKPWNSDKPSSYKTDGKSNASSSTVRSPHKTVAKGKQKCRLHKKKREEHMNIMAVKILTPTPASQSREISDSESSDSTVSYYFLCDSEPKSKKSPKLKRKGKKSSRAKYSASDSSVFEPEGPHERSGTSAKAKRIPIIMSRTSKNSVPTTIYDTEDTDSDSVSNLERNGARMKMLLSPEDKDRRRSTKKRYRKHSTPEPTIDSSSSKSSLFNRSEFRRNEKQAHRSKSRKKRSKRDKNINIDGPLAHALGEMRSPPKQSELKDKVAKKIKRRRKSSRVSEESSAETIGSNLDETFESVSSAELSRSIIKLYEEIHKLTLQIEASASESSTFLPSHVFDRDGGSLEPSQPDREQLITPYFDDSSLRMRTPNQSQNNSPAKKNEPLANSEMPDERIYTTHIFGDEESKNVEPQNNKNEAEYKITDDGDAYFKVLHSTCKICPSQVNEETEQKQKCVDSCSCKKENRNYEKYDKFGFESYDVQSACYHEGTNAAAPQIETAISSTTDQMESKSESELYFPAASPAVDLSPPEYHAGHSFRPVVTSFPPEYHPLTSAEPHALNEEKKTLQDYYNFEPMGSLSYIKFVSPPRFFSTPLMTHESLSKTSLYDDKPCFDCLNDSREEVTVTVKTTSEVVESILEEPTLIYTAGMAPDSAPQPIAKGDKNSSPGKGFSGIVAEQCAYVIGQPLKPYTIEPMATLREHFFSPANVRVQKENSALSQQLPTENDDMGQKNLNPTKPYSVDSCKVIKRPLFGQKNVKNNDQMLKGNRTQSSDDDGNEQKLASTEKTPSLGHQFSRKSNLNSQPKSPKAEKGYLKGRSQVSNEKTANLKQQRGKETDNISQGKRATLAQQHLNKNSSVSEEDTVTSKEHCLSKNNELSRDKKTKVTQQFVREHNQVSQDVSPQARLQRVENENSVSNKAKPKLPQKYSEQNNPLSRENNAKLNHQRSQEIYQVPQGKRTISAQQYLNGNDLPSNSTQQNIREYNTILGGKGSQSAKQSSDDSKKVSGERYMKSSQSLSGTYNKVPAEFNKKDGTSEAQHHGKKSDNGSTAKKHEELALCVNNVRSLPKRCTFKATSSQKNFNENGNPVLVYNDRKEEVSAPSERDKESNGFQRMSRTEPANRFYTGDKAKDSRENIPSPTSRHDNDKSKSQSETMLFEKQTDSYTSLPAVYAPTAFNAYYEEAGNSNIGKGFPGVQNVSCVWDSEHCLTDAGLFEGRSNVVEREHPSEISNTSNPVVSSMNRIRDIFFGSVRALELTSDTKQHACPPKSRSRPRSKSTHRPRSSQKDGKVTGKCEEGASTQQPLDNSDLDEYCTGGYISARQQSSHTSDGPTHATKEKSDGKLSPEQVKLKHTNGRDKGAGEMDCESRNYDVELWERGEAKTLGVQGRNLWLAPEASIRSDCKSWESSDDAEIASKLVSHYSDAIKSSRRQNRPDCSPRPPITKIATSHEKAQGRQLMQTETDEGTKNVGFGLTHQVGKYHSLDKVGLNHVPKTLSLGNQDPDLRKSQSLEPTYPDREHDKFLTSFEHLMNLKRPCYVQHCGFRRKQHDNTDSNSQTSSNDKNCSKTSSETSPQSDNEYLNGKQNVLKHEPYEENRSFYEATPFKRIAEDSYSFCQEDLSDDEEHYNNYDEESDEEEEKDQKEESEADEGDTQEVDNYAERNEEDVSDEESDDEDKSADEESGDDDFSANINSKVVNNSYQGNGQRRESQSWNDYGDTQAPFQNSRNYSVDFDESEDENESEGDEVEEEEEEDAVNETYAVNKSNNCSRHVFAHERGEKKPFVQSEHRFSKRLDSRLREGM